MNSLLRSGCKTIVNLNISVDMQNVTNDFYLNLAERNDKISALQPPKKVLFNKIMQRVTLDKSGTNFLDAPQVTNKSYCFNIIID